ncbi:hypothetical protein J2S78_002755 [Salibacterium salarium]|uniref:hypothetical protein n=1 Tax=Salibacterium salarium TaxID=284579 RepID=UPI00278B2C0D|nr:hypothetical protein [Salibacterium salarium]MDQ0300308.1 hypothetical protein [Salibacterium salarium]
MARTKEVDFSYPAFGYTFSGERGYADGIDTGIGVGLDGPYINLYSGGSISNIYHIRDDLNFNASQTRQLSRLDSLLNDYFMVGADSPSLDWDEASLVNKSNGLDIDVTGSFTLFTHIKRPVNRTRDYMQFSITRGWTLSIPTSWDDFVAGVKAIVVALLLVALGYLIVTTTPAAVAGAAATGFILSAINGLA